VRGPSAPECEVLRQIRLAVVDNPTCWRAEAAAKEYCCSAAVVADAATFTQPADDGRARRLPVRHSSLDHPEAGLLTREPEIRELSKHRRSIAFAVTPIFRRQCAGANDECTFSGDGVDKLPSDGKILINAAQLATRDRCPDACYVVMIWRATVEFRRLSYDIEAPNENCGGAAAKGYCRAPRVRQII